MVAGMVAAVVLVVLAVGVGVGVLVSNSGGDDGPSSTTPLGGTSSVKTEIETAVDGCGGLGNVDQDGRGVTYQGESASASGRAIVAAECVVKALDARGGIIAQIDHTTAMSGTQTASWGNYSITWSYNGVSDAFFMSITQD
jgi:hypothetical protein